MTGPYDDIALRVFKATPGMLSACIRNDETILMELPAIYEGMLDRHQLELDKGMTEEEVRAFVSLQTEVFALFARVCADHIVALCKLLGADALQYLDVVSGATRTDDGDR